MSGTVGQNVFTMSSESLQRRMTATDQDQAKRVIFAAPELL